MIPLPAERARAIEWVVELALTAMLPAMDEPLIIGGRLIVQDVTTRLDGFFTSTSGAPRSLPARR